MEEEGQDLSVFGQETIFNEDAKFYKDVYVFGRLYYDFDSGITEKFGDVQFDGNAIFNGITTFTGDVDIQKELEFLQVGILTVTQEFYVGESPDENVLNIRSSDGRLGVGSTAPTQTLDVQGNMRLHSQLYDSLNNPGVLGAFLTKDVTGVKWVEFEPSFSEGIFVYNEGTLVGTSSFRGLNLITSGGGSLLELVEGSVNPGNPNIADIAIRGFWEKRPAGLVTSSYIGIGLTNPTEILTVEGNTRLQGDLLVLGISSFFQRVELSDGFLAAGAGSTILSDFTVTGITTVDNDFNVGEGGDARFENQVRVEGNTELDNFLYVGSATTLASSFRVLGVSTFLNQIQVGNGISVQDYIQAGAGATIGGDLLVGLGATIDGTLNVKDAVEFDDSLEVTGVVNFLDTLTVSGNTILQGELNVVQAVDFDDTLNVDGNTTLQGTLGVGQNGSVIQTTGIGSVGFGTADPQRDVEFTEKDVYFNGGAIYDSNNQLGVTSEYTDERYRVPRTVLSQVGVGTTGLIAPRFFDAANLIRLNLDFIAGEAVGFITSYEYKDPPFSLNTSNYRNCRDDIKEILRSVCTDITKGGNSSTVGAGLSYYNGSTLLHITGTDLNGYSIKDATVEAVSKAGEVSKYVINNALYPRSYQIPAINDLYADASRMIFLNKDFIAAEAVDRTKNTYPSLTIPNSDESCIDDIKEVLDALVYNLSFSGNDRIYDAAKYYVEEGFLAGEEQESIYAYEQARDIAIDVMRNNTVTKISGTLNTYTQYSI